MDKLEVWEMRTCQEWLALIYEYVSNVGVLGGAGKPVPLCGGGSLHVDEAVVCFDDVENKSEGHESWEDESLTDDEAYHEDLHVCSDGVENESEGHEIWDWDEDSLSEDDTFFSEEIILYIISLAYLRFTLIALSRLVGRWRD